jgi:hypothetical protein
MRAASDRSRGRVCVLKDQARASDSARARAGVDEAASRPRSIEPVGQPADADRERRAAACAARGDSAADEHGAPVRLPLVPSGRQLDLALSYSADLAGDEARTDRPGIRAVLGTAPSVDHEHRRGARGGAAVAALALRVLGRAPNREAFALASAPRSRAQRAPPSYSGRRVATRPEQAMATRMQDVEAEPSRTAWGASG